VPTSEWSADDIELVNVDRVVEQVERELRAALGENATRVGRRTVRVQPKSRPAVLLIRLGCKFSTVEMTLCQEGAQNQVISFRTESAQGTVEDWVAQVCGQIIAQSK
jgi:hypothetical protein